TTCCATFIVTLASVKPSGHVAPGSTLPLVRPYVAMPLCPATTPMRLAQNGVGTAVGGDETFSAVATTLPSSGWIPGARNLGDVNRVNIVETIRDAANVMTNARKLLTIVISVYRSLRGLATGIDFLGRGVELGRGFSGAGGTGSTAGTGGAGCTGS